MGKITVKYLYCVVRGKVPKNRFDVSGLEGERVYPISEGGLSCLISNTSCDHYPLWREHITAHQAPIEEAMKHYDVLPFSFSNVAETEDQIKEKVLRERSGELKELFQKFKGKTEVGLKAFWPDMQPVFQEIAEKTPELQHLKKRPRLTYQQQIAAGELVEKLLEKKRGEEARKILEPVRLLADDYKELQLIGKNMIVNAAFLIEKGQEMRLSQKIQELADKYKDVKFNCSGPFPLYNFVSLKIHLV